MGTIQDNSISYTKSKGGGLGRWREERKGGGYGGGNSGSLAQVRVYRSSRRHGYRAGSIDDCLVASLGY